jgi:hypothetical protein
MTERDQAHESLRGWSAVAPAWEASRQRLFENLRSVSEWLVDHVGPEAGQTILELTAGPARRATWLRRGWARGGGSSRATSSPPWWRRRGVVLPNEGSTTSSAG